MLDGDIDFTNQSIFISDLEQTKGFEFDYVVITGCSNTILPAPDLPKEESYKELSKLYVAMTRAKQVLIISFSKGLSEFFKKSKNYFREDSWNNQVTQNENIKISLPEMIPVCAIQDLYTTP